MIKEPEVLKIVKEDILEVLGRKSKKIPLKLMKLEISVSQFFVSKAINELEREDLIKLSLEEKYGKQYIQLTKRGQNRAKDIIKKHLILEEYFKKRMSRKKAINATNVLEHYISTEVVDVIKKLSTFKKKGIPLTRFKKEEGLITNINFSIGLFERLISMGIYPGGKIRIINRVPNGVIIKIKNKKFVLDKDIAKEIKVLEYKNPTL